MNNWLDHVKKYRTEHNCSLKEALKEAKNTYTAPLASLKGGSGREPISRYSAEARAKIAQQLPNIVAQPKAQPKSQPKTPPKSQPKTPQPKSQPKPQQPKSQPKQQPKSRFDESTLERQAMPKGDGCKKCRSS
jgi:outer membrane biosynthesis protein TonB